MLLKGMYLPDLRPSNKYVYYNVKIYEYFTEANCTD